MMLVVEATDFFIKNFKKTYGFHYVLLYKLAKALLTNLKELHKYNSSTKLASLPYFMIVML